MSFFKKLLCVLGVCFGLAWQCYAEVPNDELVPLEAARLKFFATLYPKELRTIAQKRDFAKKHYKNEESHETFTFPNQTIANVYQAYITSYTHNPFAFMLRNNTNSTLLHRELPQTDKAFRGDGYILIYVWNGAEKLTITTTYIRNEELCGREVLEFESNAGQTTLKTSLEQYCSQFQASGY